MMMEISKVIYYYILHEVELALRAMGILKETLMANMVKIHWVVIC